MERKDGKRRSWGERRDRCKDCGVKQDPRNTYVVKKKGRLYFHTYCRGCNTRRTAQWKRRNPEKYERIARATHLKRYYGVTQEWYERVLARQDGGCAICGAIGFSSRKRAHVDHDRCTGSPRGLLCGACNGALERVQSIPDWAAKAAAYLAGYAKGAAEK